MAIVPAFRDGEPLVFPLGSILPTPILFDNNHACGCCPECNPCSPNCSLVVRVNWLVGCIPFDHTYICDWNPAEQCWQYVDPPTDCPEGIGTGLLLVNICIGCNCGDAENENPTCINFIVAGCCDGLSIGSSVASNLVAGPGGICDPEVSLAEFMAGAKATFYYPTVSETVIEWQLMCFDE